MSNPLKDLKLSLVELKAIAKIRSIKFYKSMSEDELLRSLTHQNQQENQKQIFLIQE